MKKIGLSLIALICAVVIPVSASAATGTIFGSSSPTLIEGTTTENGNTVQIKNSSTGNTYIYLGANVTSGTLNEYKDHIELSNSNFKYKSFVKENGWSGTVKASEDGKGIDVDLKSTAGLTGRGLVATISLSVSEAAPSTDVCNITLKNIASNEVEEKEPEIIKCKEVSGTYYDANGNKVSKEAYEKSCVTTENPQTGSFLPYTMIALGAGIAFMLYLLTKKNTKMYRV